MTPRTIPRSGHPLSRRDIDPHAVRVLYRLYRAGHVSYLVGGGVRDLLLGIPPKDFDVATDAHPQRVRKLFRNCVLVGRRFRLAHVRFGSTVIEVSTFRRAPAPSEGAAPGSELLIRQDNTFGTPEDDALRRDFTINALFYDIGTFAIIDYVGGLADLEDGFVRSIGDPRVRYQEDPVRMIRAVKFAARLGFDIVDTDLEAIAVHRRALALSSVPRLLEETYKLLRAGASAQSLRLLHELGLLDELLPDVEQHLRRTRALEDAENAPFFRALFALDEIVEARDTPPTNAFLLAALLLPLLEEALKRHGAHPWTAHPNALEEASEAVVQPVLRKLTVSRRDAEHLRFLLHALGRLAGERAGAPRRERSPITARTYFHEAVELLALASALDPELVEVSERWRERAEETPPAEPQQAPPRRPRRHRRRLRD